MFFPRNIKKTNMSKTGVKFSPQVPFKDKIEKTDKSSLNKENWKVSFLKE